MVGHKRPNGIVTCPVDPIFDLAYDDASKPTTPPPAAGPSLPNSPLRRETVIPGFGYAKAGEAFRYRNPNWEEATMEPIPYIPRPSRHSGTPDSWVSTEPADDLPVCVKQEPGLSPINESAEVQVVLTRPPSSVGVSGGTTETEDTSPPVPTTVPTAVSTTTSLASTATSSSRIRRSFTSIFNTGAPLLSLLSARREDVARITRSARRNGLHAGVMRPPSLSAVKEEGECSSGSKQQRDSYWIVVGRDPVAVEHIMELKENEHLAKLDAAQLAYKQSLTSASPSPLDFKRPHQFSTVDLFCFGTFIAVFVVVFGLVSLSLL